MDIMRISYDQEKARQREVEIGKSLSKSVQTRKRERTDKVLEEIISPLWGEIEALKNPRICKVPLKESKTDSYSRVDFCCNRGNYASFTIEVCETQGVPVITTKRYYLLGNGKWQQWDQAHGKGYVQTCEVLEAQFELAKFLGQYKAKHGIPDS
jgi:hypothetical protein